MQSKERRNKYRYNIWHMKLILGRAQCLWQDKSYGQCVLGGSKQVEFNKHTAAAVAAASLAVINKIRQKIYKIKDLI